jgi:hypothetical protein
VDVKGLSDRAAVTVFLHVIRPKLCSRPESSLFSDDAPCLILGYVEHYKHTLPVSQQNLW